MNPARSSAAASEARKWRAVDRREWIFRTAKRTARFSTTAKIPEIQQTVLKAAMKVVDRSYRGHAMVEKSKGTSDLKVRFNGFNYVRVALTALMRGKWKKTVKFSSLKLDLDVSLFNFLTSYHYNQPIGTCCLKWAVSSVIASSHAVFFFCWNMTKNWIHDAGEFENN